MVIKNLMIVLLKFWFRNVTTLLCAPYLTPCLTFVVQMQLFQKRIEPYVNNVTKWTDLLDINFDQYYLENSRTRFCDADYCWPQSQWPDLLSLILIIVKVHLIILARSSRTGTKPKSIFEHATCWTTSNVIMYFLWRLSLFLSGHWRSGPSVSAIQLSCPHYQSILPVLLSQSWSLCTAGPPWLAVRLQ